MFLKELKKKIRSYWPLYFVALLIYRPKIFLQEFIYDKSECSLYFKSLRQFSAEVISDIIVKIKFEKGGLLIVLGSNQPTAWLQIWSFLGLIYQAGGKPIYCLTSKNAKIQNLYINRCKFRSIFIEDLNFDREILDSNLVKLVSKLETFNEFKDFEIDSIPFGKMSLSTYSRLNASGVMDIKDDKAKNEISKILLHLLKCHISAGKLYAKYDIKMVFMSELFMEFYGSFYYSALENKLNIIRFNGTVRDNAIVASHMTKANDRKHFSSLSDESMKILNNKDLSPNMIAELDQNFTDRYGNLWGLSARNQLNTKIVDSSSIRKSFNISNDEKVGIIYSHILYDTLFFNGEYVFNNYAEWLVETIRAACLNPSMKWFIKVHPSNLWRGELEHYHAGKYEEVRLIEEEIGTLPDHVRLIFPDTPFSPFSWLQVADIGVTVTGTSGIELGALGKIVITAGTGRYENVGFTINSITPDEYKQRILLAHELPIPSDEQTLIAKKFAHATFCMKPFVLEYFKAKPRVGKTNIYGPNDLAFTFNWNDNENMPNSLIKFLKWSFEGSKNDFLTDEV